MKKTLYLLILILVLGLGFWYWKANRPEIIFSDTVVKGDYAVEKGQRIALAEGATLTVEGNLDIEGRLSCQAGPLRVIVQGDLNVSGEIVCDDGDIQLVERKELLAVSAEQIGDLYEEAAKDAGGGQRVGPFKGEEEQARSDSTNFSELNPSDVSKFSFLIKAQAASHTAVVTGKVAVGTPPPGVKRIVVFNFPTAAGLQIKDLELEGPAGRPGADDKGVSCTAKGKDGEDAFRFLAYAGNLTVNNFTLKLGSGGKGGDAETTKDCDPGMATGGASGQSGNFKMIAGNEFKITGAFIIEPGKGGRGGDAVAHGKDVGPSQKGGDATASGGKGADNNKKLGISGTVAGTEHVQIGSVVGGPGGDATANPGKGGDGLGCASPGGPGGSATASGGQGGKASLNLAGSAGRTPGGGAQEDVGGDGGNADSQGGQGGEGGDCGPQGPGGKGGNGGDATSKPGSGGVGSSKNGADGSKNNETGGNGGDGGDGCPEGNGGKGGKGNPQGTDGKPGKNLCLAAKAGSQTIPDETSNVDTGLTPTPTPPGQKIQVILYHNKYIPIDNQLHREPGHETDPSRSCPAEHWHSFEGIVISTDKTQIAEPADPCGFGATKDHPLMEIEVPN